MKDTILEKASDMFLNLGFKSVTMDDIASELGISKKTIYAHYSNKTKLVESATFYLFDKICSGIEDITAAQFNPIEELFEIKSYAIKNLKDEKSSPQYQLQKYYPKLYKILIAKQFDYMQTSVTENLEKGISQGLYRPEIDTQFIGRLYFLGMVGIKNPELFPRATDQMNALVTDYLEYHLRAIVTEKGLQLLTNYLQK
ncbi:MAG: TetR/AcrR family transcriptional regulator [Flavobacteriaceae bacterium]|nr:TetR/AcrR family transcriptional regulator [Flavobacteriaceae bacterium]